MDKQIKDRRIRKTKKLLRDTLVELMNEKSMENITVKDLTERADLNRGTFYLHYYDIFDLLEQIGIEMLQEMSEILCKIDPSEFIEYSTTNSEMSFFSVNANPCYMFNKVQVLFATEPNNPHLSSKIRVYAEHKIWQKQHSTIFYYIFRLLISLHLLVQSLKKYLLNLV